MAAMCAPPAVPAITSEERVYVRNDHAPGAVRLFVRARLGAWGLGHLADNAELVASELVTNSVRNAPGNEVAVRLEASGGAVCVRVWDAGGGLPRRQENVTWDSECGRGLMIVTALALEWGAYPADEGGKVTWATVAEASVAEAAITEASVMEASVTEAAITEAGRW